MPNRHGSSSSYRYGFNGMEKDDEVKGEGNSINYEARMLDTRVGRFLSIDPLFKAFAWFSPYQFAGNSPISCVDLDGLEMYFAADGSFLGQSKKGGTEIRIATKYTPLKAQKNGKIDEGFRITKSIPLDHASFATQGKIYQTIYDREIGGKAKIEVNNKYADGESISGGTAAHTIQPLGKGSIVVNPDFYEEYNGKFGIGNSDYYSATAVLKHEEKHFKGLGSDPWTDHLQVWIQSFKEIVKDGTYSKLGNDHKDYIYKVGVGYIEEMKMSLSTSKGVKSEDFDYAYDLLKKNVELFNKVSGSKLKLGSKESYLESRKYNNEN